MVLQLNRATPPTTEQTAPTPPPVPPIDPAREPEPAVPVYRYFLSGGANQLRLSTRSAGGLALATLLAVPLALTLAGHALLSPAPICLTLIAALTCLGLAALVARWAGRTSGTTAGLLALAGWAIASATLADPVTLAGAAAAVGAILVYALAELPNRAAAIPRAPAAIAFYACAIASFFVSGLGSPAVVAAVCLGTVLGNQNSRGLRFFLDPAGLIVLFGGVATAILTATAWMPGSLVHANSLWGSTLCLAVGAILAWAYWRTGHGASPLGCLFISWLLLPATMATLGVVSLAWALAVLVPAWAAATAPGMVGLWRNLRAGRRRNWLSSPTTGTTRPTR